MIYKIKFILIGKIFFIQNIFGSLQKYQQSVVFLIRLMTDERKKTQFLATIKL